MLSALCLLMLYRRRWGWMGLCGFLAATSRAQGLVLLLPGLYEWLLTIRGRRGGLLKGLFLLLIPLGTGVFLLINRVVAGDALAFVAYEAAPPWYNSTRWIAENLTTHFSMAVDDGYLGAVIYWPQLLLYFAGVGAILWGLYRGERISFMAYGGAYIFVSYLHGWLISGPRYMLSCLPLFLMTSRLRPWLRMTLLIAWAGMGVAYMVMYLMGGAIM